MVALITPDTYAEGVALLLKYGEARHSSTKTKFRSCKKGSKSTADDQEQDLAERAGGGANSQALDMANILQEMRQGFATVVDKVDRMSSRMDAIAHKLDGHEDCIKEAVGHISESDDVTATHRVQLTRIDKLLPVIATKNEDLEARSRRNNIRVIGIPESTNTGRMEDYIEKLLLESIGKDAFSSQFIVERAHRTLGPHPVPGSPPRPIIARLLKYRDRDVALRAARNKQKLTYDGNTFSIYPDFTPIVQEERRSACGSQAEVAIGAN